MMTKISVVVSAVATVGHPPASSQWPMIVTDVASLWTFSNYR